MTYRIGSRNTRAGRRTFLLPMGGRENENPFIEQGAMMHPFTRRFVIEALSGAAFIGLSGNRAAAQTDLLPSWNDGPAKQAILDFVGRVTREGRPDYVPPAQRIAAFDNDGTLWAEQPIYFQF